MMPLGTLTMHMADRDFGKDRAYWLTCSCGAKSPESVIRDYVESDDAELRDVQQFIVDGWGKTHRCARWRVEEGKTSDSWLQLEDTDTEMEDNWSAYAKFDGCCEVTHRGGYSDPSQWDHLHICGVQAVDEWIARLQEMRAKMLEHFDEEDIR